MTALHPLFAYGWYWGWWWWWWIVILFFLWWLLLPPFSYGRRWYGGYRSRGAGVGTGGGYATDWQAIESRFIESPAAGIAEADRVVGDLMARARPSTGMEQEYRDAHAVAVKAQSGTATADEMRAAMLKYRGLFDRLAPVT